MVGYKVLLGTSSYRSHRLLLSQVAPSRFKVVLGKEERGVIGMARGRGNWDKFLPIKSLVLSQAAW